MLLIKWPNIYQYSFSRHFTRLVRQEQKIVHIRRKNQIKFVVEQTTDDIERKKTRPTKAVMLKAKNCGAIATRN